MSVPVPAAASTGHPPATELIHTGFDLRGVRLRNRVVMAAMTTGFASPAGRPTPRLIAWYEARSSGGAGLVIVEGTLVATPHPLTPAPRFRQHRLRLDGDGAVPAFRRLAEAIHRGGARAAIQLTYPAVSDPAALPAAALAGLAPAFAAAAARAGAAGFDAVEVQCSYRTLLAQLLSGATNRRQDKYGRRPAGRLRALLEIVAAIRAATGDRLPVLVKLSADEYLPRGLKPEQSAAIARALAQAGCAGIEVIGGAVATDATLRLSSGVGEATLADLAGTIRNAVHPLGLPVIAAGRILSLETGERVLRDEQADLVATGRALLADPALVAKARAGIEVEAIPCIGCMACYTPAPDGGIGCPVNGEAGHEHLPPLELAPRPRRLTILGASLAGLELARVAATRGHEVELASAGLPLGGLLGLRAGVPGNAEFGRAFLYFGDRLVELGVSMVETPELGAEVTVDCRPQPELRPAWARGRGVLFAADVLGRDLHEMYGIGRRVAVAGPGALAAEVALFLAGWGRRPTVIVPGPPEAPFPDVHPMHGARLQERLEGYKIPLVTDTTPVAWQYDENRKSQLLVRQGGRGAREITLGPFHSAVSAAGWPAVGGQRHQENGLVPWPSQVKIPRVPDTIADGTTLVVGDTLYPEPLRDLVAYAHRVGRIL